MPPPPPIIGKLFESCLYPVLDPFCTSHANQFSFVANGGTKKAIFAEHSTVDYFYDRGSDVYVYIFDAEKAFDHVNYYFLFFCMLLKGVPINIVNLLIAWYSHIELTVLWQGKLSKAFNAKSGIYRIA